MHRARLLHLCILISCAAPLDRAVSTDAAGQLRTLDTYPAAAAETEPDRGWECRPDVRGRCKARAGSGLAARAPAAWVWVSTTSVPEKAGIWRWAAPGRTAARANRMPPVLEKMGGG